MYGFHKYMVLDKEHQKEIDDHLDDIYERERTKEQLRNTINKKNIEISKNEDEIFNLTKENEEIRKNLYITKRDAEKEINELKEQLSSTIKETNEKIDSLSFQLEAKDKLLIKESKKYLNLKKFNDEHKKDILKLKKDLEVISKDLEIANNKVEFYKARFKEPTMEELKTYTFSRKEVEKRLKSKGE